MMMIMVMVIQWNEFDTVEYMNLVLPSYPSSSLVALGQSEFQNVTDRLNISV